MYGDATLNADVATSHLEVDERGVTTMIYSVPGYEGLGSAAW